MVKIGILGTDGGMQSGHTKAVCNIFKEHGKEWETQIVSIFGDNAGETTALAAEYSIDVPKRYEDMTEAVDAVMIMPRDGSKHLKYALPFIEKGMPLFMDKPFTSSAEDAAAVAAAAKKSGAPICGGSYVKYTDAVSELKELAQSGDNILSGYIAFPTQMNSAYGFHFYSHHAIEVMLTIFGNDIKDIRAAVTDDKLTVIAKYAGFPVILNYATTYTGLSAGIYLENSGEIMRKIDLSGKEAYQCKRFVEMVKSRRGDDLQHFIDTVNISCAIEKEIIEGRV